MATLSKQDAIVKMALEFYIDEGSLVSALSKAQAKYKSQNAQSRSASIAEENKMYKSLEAESKKTNIKISRDRKIIKEKSLNEERAQESKARKRNESEAKASANKIASDKKKTLVGGFDNFGAKLGTISSYGAAIVVINALRQAITYAISKTIEFEKSFTDLAVKSGFTKNEMNSVTKSVYDVANATKFSTLEIVEAATALGKLGFEANEVVDILPHLATVAGATGESLEATARVFGTVINAYQMSADNAQNVADRMVQIFNNSALDLEKFNTAFSYVGSAAASTGTSFDELTAAMAILSDRGVTASKIGTGLRNVFTKLGKEGDTLRDILERVNNEQLSFYELADLVGRRAANQLFILTDSFEEFDDVVASSSDKYGTAMEANALQMSTFSAKWDIFINNITNKVAGDDADPLKDFRYNLVKTIDIWDKINSFNLFNDKGSEAGTSNFLNANQKIFEEIRNIKAKNADLTEKEIKDILLKPYKVLNDNEFIQSTDLNKLNAMGLERSQIKKLFENSDGDDVFTAIKVYEEGLAKTTLSDAQDAYTNNIKSISEFISSNTTAKIADEIKEAVFVGDQATVDALFQGAFGEGKGKLSTKEYDKYKAKLQKVLDDKANLTIGAVKAYKDSSSGSSAYEGLKKEIESLDASIFRLNLNLKAGDDGKLKGDKRDILNLDKANDERNTFIEKWCGLAKEQPYLKRWLSEFGIICEETREKKSKAKIEKIDPFTALREEYKTKKDSLTKQFGIEDDPQKKIALNNRLIDLESTFRDRLNQEYEDYLSKQEALKTDFIRRNPDQRDQFLDNIKSTKSSQIKDREEGNRNQNTYSNRDISAKAEAYKQDITNRAKYLEAMSSLNLKLKATDRKDLNERRVILDAKNKLSKDYYLEAEQDLSLHFESLKLELIALEKLNMSQLAKGGTLIDTTALKTRIKELEAELRKLREEANKAQDFGGKGDTSDFDYFAAAIETSDNMYNLYAEIGDRKLELLKEQNARELEEISNRFDREANIIQASVSNGIISQEQGIEADERIRRKKIANENKANKKLFEAQKKRDKEDAIFQGLSATASAVAVAFSKTLPTTAVVLAAISAAAIAASTAMNVGAISKRKFVPQKFAEGGVIQGKSHAQGGVPFTVAGRGGFEAEGGEFIVNKEATSKHLDELKRINSKTKTSSYKFATGGQVVSVNTDSDMNKALLEAFNRPVRAYVTEQDLAKSDSERKALSRKTSY